MVSYGYIVIATILILGGAIFSVFILPINEVFRNYNGFIDTGMVTQQNYDAMEFQRYIVLIAPLIILLGCLSWGLVRAIEKKLESSQ